MLEHPGVMMVLSGKTLTWLKGRAQRLPWAIKLLFKRASDCSRPPKPPSDSVYSSDRRTTTAALCWSRKFQISTEPATLCWSRKFKISNEPAALCSNLLFLRPPQSCRLGGNFKSSRPVISSPNGVLWYPIKVKIIRVIYFNFNRTKMKILRHFLKKSRKRANFETMQCNEVESFQKCFASRKKFAIKCN